MTTLTEIGLHCPVCQTDFLSFSAAKATAYRKRTDFQERTAGTPPLPFQIHQCTGCGYAGGQDNFNFEPADVPTEIRDWILAEIKPEFGGGCSTPWEKYEAAAKIAGFVGILPPQDVADLYLRAAWCCAIEGEVEREEERFYRLKAIDWIIEALEGFDTISREERATYVYLVGELFRRIGKRKDAISWFNSVQDEIIDTESQTWIYEAAIRQRDDPQEWFD